MIRFSIFLISLILLLISCQKEDNTILEYDRLLERPNNPPDSFQIRILSVSDTTAVIEWENSVDREKDFVTYSIYLLDSLYIENIHKDSIYLFKQLIPNTYYSGKIIATDGISQTILNFSFYTKVNPVEWERTYPFPINKVEKTSDGGYISYSTLIKNSICIFLLTKLNADGSVEWHREWSDFNPDPNSRFIRLSQTNDGGYIVTNGKQIVKANSQGVEIWKNTRNDNNNWYVAVVQGSDKGYLALYGVNRIIKFNSTGEILWEKENNYGNNDQIIATSDNNFIRLSVINNRTIIFEKIDSNGNRIWANEYDNTFESYPTKIFESKSGNIILFGFSIIGSYSRPCGRILITKSNGELINDQIVDLGIYGTYINAVDELPNKDLIVVGTKDNYNYETFLAHISANTLAINEDKSYLNYELSDILALSNDCMLLVGIKPFPLFDNEIDYWVCKKAIE